MKGRNKGESILFYYCSHPNRGSRIGIYLMPGHPQQAESIERRAAGINQFSRPVVIVEQEIGRPDVSMYDARRVHKVDGVNNLGDQENFFALSGVPSKRDST